jgi:prepilin-type processing-associated H-X9-DG protein
MGNLPTAQQFHISYLYNTAVARASDSSMQNPTGTVMVVDGATTPAAGTSPLEWLNSPKGTAFLISAIANYATAGDASEGGRAEDFGAPSARHLETANVLYVDGHVKATRVERFYDFTIPPPNRMPCLDPSVGCS